MLERPISNEMLATDVQAYLYEALGAVARIRQWDGARNLPNFLQDAFDLHRFRLRDKEFLLAGARNGRMPAIRTLRTQLDTLGNIADLPIVFAISTLASYERKRLVEQKIPFVVPGNQLYLPDLGIDFREYFRQPQSAVTAFTPATQAIFIAALLRRQWRDDWQPANLIAELGYTSMTLTRAVREFTAAGLITAHQEGRARRLHVKFPPAQAWEQALPFLRTPVKRTVRVDSPGLVKRFHPPLAGLSALAFYSMLTEPRQPIYAVPATLWKIVQQREIQALPESQPGDSEWQLWSYKPDLPHDSTAVDPLSLMLSLEKDPDDRIQQALDGLRGQFRW